MVPSGKLPARSADGWAAVLGREQVITLAGLACVVALAWLYLLRLSRQMSDMAAMGMAQMAAWTVSDVVMTTAMWAIMMVAMMLPTAAPMILMFATINRKRRVEDEARYVDTGLFTLGYLLLWCAFSVGAALAQWAFHGATLLSEDATKATPWLGSGLLVAAGIYQWSPLKYACLARCRSPLGFLLGEWRAGGAGALIMGLRYGLFCLGCCWVLMALLFIGGVMNLTWVAAITVFVVAEKLVPAGRAVSWATGAVLCGWGLIALRHAWTWAPR